MTSGDFQESPIGIVIFCDAVYVYAEFVFMDHFENEIILCFVKI